MANPIIAIEPSRWERAIDRAHWILLALSWSIPIYYYPKLPDTIPLHFGLHGEADGFGSKLTIWLLPIIATILLLAIKAQMKHPEKFNYLAKITPENAKYQYKLQLNLLRYILLVVLLLFIILDSHTISLALYDVKILNVLFFPMIILLIAVPIFVTIHRSTRQYPKSPR